MCCAKRHYFVRYQSKIFLDTNILLESNTILATELGEILWIDVKINVESKMIISSQNKFFRIFKHMLTAASILTRKALNRYNIFLLWIFLILSQKIVKTWKNQSFTRKSFGFEIFNFESKFFVRKKLGLKWSI